MGFVFCFVSCSHVNIVKKIYVVVKAYWILVEKRIAEAIAKIQSNAGK